MPYVIRRTNENDPGMGGDSKGADPGIYRKKAKPEDLKASVSQ